MAGKAAPIGRVSRARGRHSRVVDPFRYSRVQRGFCRIAACRGHGRIRSLPTARHGFRVAAVIKDAACGECHEHTRHQRHKSMLGATAPEVQQGHRDGENDACPGGTPAPNLREQSLAQSGSGCRRILRRPLGETHDRHCACTVQPCASASCQGGARPRRFAAISRRSVPSRSTQPATAQAEAEEPPLRPCVQSRSPPRTDRCRR
jgi:hypothetical protein